MNNTILLIVVVFIILLIISDKNITEDFSTAQRFSTPATNFANHSVWDNLFEGPVVNDCYDLKPGDCLKSSNCGLCGGDGDGDCTSRKCVPGDADGPLFTGSCDKWTYNDHYGRKIFNETEVVKSRPWSHRYPEYEYANMQRPF